jgi:hypothetical protein
VSNLQSGSTRSKGFGAPTLPNSSMWACTRREAAFVKHRVSRLVHTIVQVKQKLVLLLSYVDVLPYKQGAETVTC